MPPAAQGQAGEKGAHYARLQSAGKCGVRHGIPALFQAKWLQPFAEGRLEAVVEVADDHQRGAQDQEAGDAEGWSQVPDIHKEYPRHSETKEGQAAPTVLPIF